MGSDESHAFEEAPTGSSARASGRARSSPMKKPKRDYRSATDDELRAMARHARQQEETAPYAKGRRAWKSVWQAAEEELRRRANDVS
jgi:hypothetical protein